MLPFEDPDPELIPMAGRRALDRAGMKLSLRAWQRLSLPVRASVVRLGEGAEVDATRVRELLEGAHPPPERIDAVRDPDPLHVPEMVRAALGPERPLDDAAWRTLDPVGRYALANYARRRRIEKLRAAHDALVGTS